MKFRYKKKKLYANLVIGILWLVFGVSSLFFNENSNWTDYGYLVMGLIYFSMYVYNTRFQYISIQDGVIKENALFGTSLNLDEIASFRKFAGDYILQAGKKELYINTELIDSDSLPELQEFISSLELNSEKVETKK